MKRKLPPGLPGILTIGLSHYGNITRMAQAMRVDRKTVDRWFRLERPVPCSPAYKLLLRLLLERAGVELTSKYGKRTETAG